MTQSKIDIFFTLHGLDCHLEKTVDDQDEDILLELEQTAKALAEMGAQPRPQLVGRGGNGAGSGGGKPKVIVPGEKCPNCGGPLSERSGVAKSTGKPYRLWICADKGESCHKAFQRDANSTPAPVPAPAEATNSASTNTVNNTTNVVTLVQLRQIRALAQKKGVNTDRLGQRAKELYKTNLEALTVDQANDLISRLEAAPDSPKAASAAVTNGVRAAGTFNNRAGR